MPVVVEHHHDAIVNQASGYRRVAFDEPRPSTRLTAAGPRRQSIVYKSCSPAFAAPSSRTLQLTGGGKGQWSVPRPRCSLA